MDGVIDIDQLVAVAELGPGERIDPATGLVFYSKGWLPRTSLTVLALPAPEPEAPVKSRLDGINAARRHFRLPELRELEETAGAEIVRRQAATAPKDGWIGPRRLLNGLEPTDEDRLTHAAALLVDGLRGAARAAERLAEQAGPSSALRRDATTEARELRNKAAAWLLHVCAYSEEER